MKKVIKFLTGRLFITSMLILIQILLIFSLTLRLSSYSVYIHSALVIISLMMVITIISDDSNPVFKLAWVIPMLTFPFFGWLLYFIFHRRKLSSKTRSDYMNIAINSKNIIPQDMKILEEIKAQNPAVSRQCTYIKHASHANIYNNTQTDFFQTGERFFNVYLNELEKAEKFIFLEYFIIGEGDMWYKILDILTQKAAQGIDVRVMYDDFGTINTFEKNYDKKLNSLGIKTVIFNQFRASLDTFMNYRDHRKITVIDGNVGFTGGLNLSDEYINVKQRFGHWKDCAIMLKGDAVSGMSIMFLQLWYFAAKDKNQEYIPYLSTVKYESDGYVQPFGDGPMDGHLTAKLAYMGLINNASEYVYITTPYLILDSEMITALRQAAESGIDVRIITPFIPDKWYVHAVTRSNYDALIRSGVRIYEYQPGFIHSKIIISDNQSGIIGTTNFDFRSFYLHFENGIYLYKSRAILQALEDYKNMLVQCVEITPEKCASTPKNIIFARSLLRLFSPFM